MTFSNFLANSILDAAFSDVDTFLSLHTSSPLGSEMATGEITAPTYARQPVAWSIAENRTVFNLDGITFTGLPLATIPYLGVSSALNGGDLLAALEVDPPYQTNSNGSSLYIPAETIVITLQ